MGEKGSGRGPLVVIVGPTAVGKTAIALRLGEELGGEVVSADSRQLYRGMDVGTAKPSPEERRRVPHHLMDVLDPDEPFSLAQYQALAYQAIDQIMKRGRLSLLVGGSGQYVRAVVEGWVVPAVPPDRELRAALYREAEEVGAEALHARLAAVDPAAAARIMPTNVRRVIRALEVHQATGRPISQLQEKRPPGYRLLQIGLTMARAELYRRIDQRVERMIEQGLVDEVRTLIERGYGCDLPAMSSLGYREIGMHLQGQISLEEAVRLIRRNTRRFVRRQYNWFRLSDPDIRWFDVLKSPYEEIAAAVRAFVDAPVLEE